IILWTAIVLTALSFSAQQLTANQLWLSRIDNFHWTVGTVTAAALAWLGYINSSGAVQAARRWFFIGLLAYAIGQILWDIQVLIGWNPFPAPADLFYLMLGPGCLMGLAAGMKTLLPRKSQFIIVLDAVMATIASLALTLTLYLPSSSEIDLLSLSVMTAYPVVLLSAGCFGALMMLHVHPRVNWAWIMFQCGIVLQGLTWMWWNYQALTGTTTSGSLLNALFSVASLVVGVSAMHWHILPSDGKRYAQWCEKVLRMSPIFAVVVAALATIIALTVDDLLPGISDLVLSASLTVLILASWRQALMLEDSLKLLEAEQTISESSHFLQLVIDTVPAGIFWKDTGLKYLGGNTIFARDAGVSGAEMVKDKRDADMVLKDFAEVYSANDQNVLDTGTSKINFDVQVTTPAGETLWVRTSKVPMRNRNNQVIGLLGVYNDITEARQLEEWQRIAAVTFETQEAILITDPDANILRVNQSFQEVTGYSATEVIGKNPRIFQSGRHDAAFYQAMWSELTSSKKWSGEIWDRRKNGEIYPKLMTITAVSNAIQQVTHYVAVFRDISSRKKSEEDIHQLAFYDPLTKLPNRRLLVDRLQQAVSASVRNGKYGALLFLDLDHFKTINDTQGHMMGDQLLVEVARRLQANVRDGDSVARLGGDEFVVVLEGLSRDASEAASQAELVAEKIRDELEQPYLLNEFECQSSVSIGISQFLGHLET
ncbi:MAG: diguanylate cyclase, partial [Gallionella sp.]